MKNFVFMFILFISLPAFAWENPRATTAGRFITVPATKASNLTLEAWRVLGGDAVSFRYNLGEKIITIIPASAASRQFLRHVQNGSQAAAVTALLIPSVQSPFNDRFKAE